MSGKKIKKIPTSELRQEEGASELATSPDMRPYIQLAMAGMQGVAQYRERSGREPHEELRDDHGQVRTEQPHEHAADQCRPIARPLLQPGRRHGCKVVRQAHGVNRNDQSTARSKAPFR